MKVAIVGAGLAGLALAHSLSQYPNVQTTVFDVKGAGGGASGVSTGLLHPFPAKAALRSWLATEGMAASIKLLDRVEKLLGAAVAERTGILRIAVSERQKSDYKKRCLEDTDAIWVESDQVLSKLPLATPAPGLWIPSGITVYSKRYLDGLAKQCRIERVKVENLRQLDSFDRVVLATGYETLRFSECAHLDLEPTKGHSLICRWPTQRLPFSIISTGHITPTENPEFCQIGSTYEHNFTHLEPDLKAIDELKNKVAAFYPPARDFEVVDVRVGCRIAPKQGYKPIVEKLGPKLWVFTGLGSRGLLYHALLASQLAEEIVCVNA